MGTLSLCHSILKHLQTFLGWLCFSSAFSRQRSAGSRRLDFKISTVLFERMRGEIIESHTNIMKHHTKNVFLETIGLLFIICCLLNCIESFASMKRSEFSGSDQSLVVLNLFKFLQGLQGSPTSVRWGTWLEIRPQCGSKSLRRLGFLRPAAALWHSL